MYGQCHCRCHYEVIQETQIDILNTKKKKHVDSSCLERAHVIKYMGVRRSSLLLLIYVSCYITYLIAGGAVFAALESPDELKLIEYMKTMRQRFLAEHPCVGDNELETLIQEVVEASSRGVSAVRNVSGEPNWSFGQSLFFSCTVVTTIGYGHVTPLSKGGKIFCILYAMVGIPLTLMLLTALVERLMIPSTMFLQYLNSRLGHLYQPFSLRLLHLAIVAAFTIFSFFLIPATFFALLEPGWDYLDSLYYCFISLTTVGLGDYVPGDSPDQPYRPLYKVATTGYLLMGLTFLMLLLTVFYDIPELNVGLIFLLRSDETTTDPEKVRLQGGSGCLGPKYTQPNVVTMYTSPKEDDKDIPDTPSPDDTTPVHARP